TPIAPKEITGRWLCRIITAPNGLNSLRRRRISSPGAAVRCALFEHRFPPPRDQPTPDFARHLSGTTFAKAILIRGSLSAARTNGLSKLSTLFGALLKEHVYACHVAAGKRKIIAGEEILPPGPSHEGSRVAKVRYDRRRRKVTRFGDYYRGHRRHDDSA